MNVIEFPRAPVVAPLYDESRRFARNIDHRHALRWYDLGTRAGFNIGLRQYAIKDGPTYISAYNAGWIARTFGVDLRHCFQ